MSVLTPAAARRVFWLLTATRWLPVGLTVALFPLWPLEHGLSITQVLTLASVVGVVILLLELPTSGFADAFGRRPVLVAAAVAGVVSMALYLFATSFWTFALAMAVQGVFRALDSGPLEAWYVDTVHLHRPGADVDQELSRAGTVLGASLAVGALVAGGLVLWDPLPGSALRLPFAVFAAAAPLAGVLAEATSLSVSFVVLGAVSGVGALLYLPARRAERDRDAAAPRADR